MRGTIYIVTLAVLIAGALAFSTAPAIAQMTSDQKMQQSGPTIEHKGPVAGDSGSQFSGEPKAGASQQGGPVHQMKSMMNREMKGQTPQPSQAQAPTGSKQANVSAESNGGEATVARLDRSRNCLSVHRDPSASSQEIACEAKGEKLHLTGVFSKDRRWAQLDNNGWVSFRSLRTDVKPPRTAAMGRSWEQSAGAGQAMSGTRSHHYGRSHGCYPGYFYTYPGYYGWGTYWNPWY
jgi:hypothetical protein